ncbi:MAG: hypothetical protein QM725_13230 [Lacibacter sp.]
MKVVLLIMSTLLLYLKDTKQPDFLQAGKVYEIIKLKGTKADVGKILFWGKNKRIKYSSIQLKCNDKLSGITITSGTDLLAYYNIETTGSFFNIDNYLPLRDHLSFNDPQERKYKLEVMKNENGKIDIKISNYGKLNLLSRPVHLLLQSSK